MSLGSALVVGLSYLFLYTVIFLAVPFVIFGLVWGMIEWYQGRSAPASVPASVPADHKH
ncbi:hypothetical protein Fbal_0641 [Ferrimonas balearica DSM 9799]|uniref:Uncharacterized protein n=1 Tax=Ferrimonas balearica (strain DSM 9799 / CCM 4581 / KCTC 23876 / PAT) TaxID=550540 RepID=E1SR89_FERBD|nr:hypothetical protein [Ferrimonas balearica]ADN74854.1 hypothetical protein Fbal_0641 [Ferrimonas balearica DSM 9799]